MRADSGGPEGTPGKSSWESPGGQGQGVRETAAGKKGKQHGGRPLQGKVKGLLPGARTPPALRGQRLQVELARPLREPQGWEPTNREDKGDARNRAWDGLRKTNLAEVQLPK